MNYEVIWGECYHLVDAGNPYQACMLAMAECNSGKVASSFQVSTFEGQHRQENIGLDVVVSFLVLAQVGKEFDPNSERNFSIDLVGPTGIFNVRDGIIQTTLP